MVGVSTDVAITPWFDSNLEDKKDGFITFARSLIEKYNGKQFNIKFTGDLLDGRNICFSKEEKERYEQFSNSLYAGTMGDVFDLPFIEFHKEHYLEDNCEYGNLTIDAEGNVFFCPSIPVVKSSANIRTDDFNKIMELADKARRFSNVENLEPCRHCELKFICGGDCRTKFFKDFTTHQTFAVDSHPKRECNAEVKNKVYDLMVRTNEAIFQ
jgi:radical SAM protein with 4Fe4S-binding SPASM domain